ncbi:MAG: hypothetical protein IPH12_14025 [Saprospirales bacterium]|nr:hypothetical protein [Saprospirales bacterium]MBK8922851.1 hypothetical protein [Saprospirales bacterium]
MPIEIRELIIRTTVTEQTGAQNGQAGNAANSAVALNEADLNLIVEIVLNILKEKTER